MKDRNFPPNTEFDQAMYDDESKCLFLTSRISTNIFKLTIDDDVADFELIGNFDSEAKNTCLIEAEIFNFASDEFSYEISLEKFMIKEKKCEVIYILNFVRLNQCPSILCLLMLSNVLTMTSGLPFTTINKNFLRALKLTYSNCTQIFFVSFCFLLYLLGSLEKGCTWLGCFCLQLHWLFSPCSL